MDRTGTSRTQTGRRRPDSEILAERADRTVIGEPSRVGITDDGLAGAAGRNAPFAAGSRRGERPGGPAALPVRAGRRWAGLARRRGGVGQPGPGPSGAAPAVARAVGQHRAGRVHRGGRPVAGRAGPMSGSMPGAWHDRGARRACACGCSFRVSTTAPGDKDPGVYVEHAMAIRAPAATHCLIPPQDGFRFVEQATLGARFPGIWQSGSDPSVVVIPQFYHLWPALLATAIRNRRREGARRGRAAVRDARGDGGGTGPPPRRPIRSVGQ